MELSRRHTAPSGRTSTASCDAPQPLFTPAEFVALFPQPLPAPEPLSSAAIAFEDPARDARGPALSPRELLAELEPFPAVRRYAAAQLWCMVVMPLQQLRYVSMTLVFSACFALAWPFGAGIFTTRSIVTGFILQLFFNAVRTVKYSTWQKSRGVLSFPSRSDKWSSVVRIFQTEMSVRQHAGLVAWMRLFDWSTELEKGIPAAKVPSALTAHRDQDPLCPCPKASCGGSAPEDLAVASGTILVWRTTHSFLSQIAIIWTSLVTLGASSWTQPWSAVILGLGMLSAVLITAEVIVVGPNSPSPLKLTTRVRHRAVVLALGQLVDKCGVDLAAGTCAEHSTSMPSSMPYAELLALLDASWRKNFSANWVPNIMVVFIIAGIACAALSAFVARCIPAWTLLYTLYYLIALGRDLWNAAVFNAEIETISELVARAQRELRELLALRPSSPAAASVRAHDAVLDSHLRAGNGRAKVLGFTVSFGAIRTLYITLATVAFGVWGVLRGFGVEVTMDSVCPG
ncbi:hypothetical protein DFJ74DRAFT_678725 [Hyaloraphidium curvatum]|nr:hypothetical protein DFJ74DRAFT_678725 [Hyaloraphidium curvatum]